MSWIPTSNSDQQHMAGEWMARLKEQADKHAAEVAQLQESIKKGVRTIQPSWMKSKNPRKVVTS